MRDRPTRGGPAEEAGSEAEALEEHDGRLVIPASGLVIDDAPVRALRDADQRG